MTADTKSAKERVLEIEPGARCEMRFFGRLTGVRYRIVWPGLSKSRPIEVCEWVEGEQAAWEVAANKISKLPKPCQGCEDERTDPQGQHTHAEGTVEHPITICDERLRHIVYGGQDGWRLKPNTREAELMAAELLALRARPSVAFQKEEDKMRTLLVSISLERDRQGQISLIKEAMALYRAAFRAKQEVPDAR